MKKPAPRTAAPLPVIDIGVKPSTTLVQKREGMALLPPLQAAVTALKPLKTQDDYDLYDELFGKVKLARKTWKLRMYGTSAKPGPIPQIRSGLDQLYALNREVDQPLEKLENLIEGPMKRFLLDKQRADQERERERQRELDAANAKIAELEAKQAALRTPAAQAKVEQEIIEVAEELDALQMEPDPEPVQAAHSTGRPKQIPVIVDRAKWLKGVGEGLIPDDCVTDNMVKLRAYFKDDPESVKDFPGVEIQDDIQIVGR